MTKSQWKESGQMHVEWEVCSRWAGRNRQRKGHPHPPRAGGGLFVPKVWMRQWANSESACKGSSFFKSINYEIPLEEIPHPSHEHIEMNVKKVELGMKKAIWTKWMGPIGLWKRFPLMVKIFSKIKKIVAACHPISSKHSFLPFRPFLAISASAGIAVRGITKVI